MKTEQTRKDLDAADACVRACWSNFIATEPTYVLRDLIVVEIAKAREAEREACAKIADDYGEWTFWGQDKNFAAALAGAREIAAAIRKGRALTTEEIQALDKASS